ncbi:hypothetical protein ACXITP_00195 [Actinotignum sanguinis]|uniref:Uncharacterized protein n=2 Tax=Actinomycetaceae TaxID=2049 RepID=A0ABZ0RBB7_9ACTO|nr:hypothetical protein [Actinotignum sanguinis]WPJ88658.1 hypothetical protein R0V15_07250 [Schaalia turicensis]MDE1552475.1 hypothetical protein [Actinotignum sanguinis]MDE1565775.1 hypothetical protein [Actinotignum sanguinis]MDE1577017.1 hypothetical protein [Actinotignum sanguinis]MDE1642788.1 hypothetical protein [Actinotignum sanguinis]
MASSFRRPAQMKPDQLESIEGEADVAYHSELAHTAAQALLPGAGYHTEEPEVRARVLDLIATEGIDVIAEAWARSPEGTLPGMLWRGYLLREWLRRFPNDAAARLTAAREKLGSQGADGVEKLEKTPTLGDVKSSWDEVFAGSFSGDFAEVLASSARLCDTLAEVDPLWIPTDEHPLATPVTRRDAALLETAREFRAAGARAVRGTLS